MAFFDKPVIGTELNEHLKPAFEELYSMITGGSPDLLLNAENKGYVQRRNVMNSPLEPACPNFARRWRKKAGKTENQGDVNVVFLGDSVITDMDYASDMSDAPYMPPMATELNFFYYMVKKLDWKGQQYRRYDSKSDPGGPSNTFIETGTPLTKAQDPEWDWVYSSYPKPQTFYNGLTRTLVADGATNPSINFFFRSSYRRCDLLYRMDSISSESLAIAVNGGNGFFTVWDDRPGSGTINTWVEANGFVFSARMADTTLHTDQMISTTANGASLGYKKTIFQKHLKLRRTVIAESRSLTITATDGLRLGYWGIQYSTNDNMICFFNAGRGSHNLLYSSVFHDVAVDPHKPDLIIHQLPVINEMISAAGGVAVADSPAEFAGRFTPYINTLLAKPYHPEYIPLIFGLNANQKPMDEMDRFITRTISGGLGGNAATAGDFIDHLFAAMKDLEYPDLSPDPAHPNEGTSLIPVSVFWEFIRYGFARAKDTGNTAFSELFGYTSLSPLTPLAGATGRTGTALVSDGTHLNDMGNFLVWRYLEKYFEF